MAKIEYRDFKGIVTNYDHKDLAVDAIAESINFKYEPGRAEVNEPSLKFLPEHKDYISNSESYIPYLEDEWEWETSKFCTINYDALSKNSLNKSYTLIIMISKRQTLTGTQRHIWAKQLDEEDKIWTGWSQLFKNGVNSWPMTDIRENMFHSTEEGQAYIRNIDGKIKIYMPHDSFWIGHLDRELKTPNKWTTKVVNGFYIDRLTERVDIDDLSLVPATPESTYYIEYSGENPMVCSDNRRLGISANIEVVEEDEEGTPINTDFFRLEYLRMDYLPDNDSVSSFYKQEVMVCRAIKEDGTQILNPLSASYLGGQTYEWCFYRQFDLTGATPIATDRWLVPIEIADVINKRSMAGGSLLDWTEFHKIVKDPIISRRSDKLITPYNAFYRLETGTGDLPNYELWVPGTDKPKSIVTYEDLTQPEKIQNGGYSQTIKKLYIVGTIVLDQTTEIIAYYNVVDVGSISKEKFGLKFDIDLPIDINKRTTRIRFYIKTDIDEDADFQEVTDFDMLGSDDIRYENNVITEGSETGAILSQRIAFALDKDNLKDYKIITGFDDIAEDLGVSLAIKSGKSTTIHYSVLGGGNLQSDLIYHNNQLSVKTNTEFKSIKSVGNNFIVYTRNDAKVISCDDINGALVFTPRDTLEYGVEDIDKVTEGQGANIILTRNGIFITNGFEKKWLSEAINDKVKIDHNNLKILYNPVRQELIFYNKSGDIQYWLYSFERAKWEYYKLFKDRIADVFVDNEGNYCFLTNSTAFNSNERQM